MRPTCSTRSSPTSGPRSCAREIVGDDVDITVRYSSFDSSTMLARRGRVPVLTRSRTTSTTGPTAAFVDAAGGDYRLRPDSVDDRRAAAPSRRPAKPISGGCHGCETATPTAAASPTSAPSSTNALPPSPAFEFAPPRRCSATSSPSTRPRPAMSTATRSASSGASATARPRAGRSPRASTRCRAPTRPTLTATDSTGLSAAVTHPVSVGLRTGALRQPAHGARRRPTGSTGFTAGDRLDGLGGDDVLSGGNGEDCLFGERRRRPAQGRRRPRPCSIGGAGADSPRRARRWRDRADCGAGKSAIACAPTAATSCAAASGSRLPGRERAQNS